jgi:hypothetical protein
MHKIFGSEGGFQDKELRIIQSTSKRGVHDEEPSLPEPREASTQSTPSAHAGQEKAA